MLPPAPPRHTQDSPFFVDKLNVRVLPCVVMFVDGVAVDRVVGFDTLGAKDDFPTETVSEWRAGCRLKWRKRTCARSGGAAAAAEGRRRPTSVAPRVLASRLACPLPQLERRLLKAGAVLAPQQQQQDDSDDEEGVEARRTLRSSVLRRTASDEDSDFD